MSRLRECAAYFATPRFGPQDLRVLMGKVNSFGMAVAADAGIESVADVEGRRVAYPAANPSSATSSCSPVASSFTFTSACV